MSAKHERTSSWLKRLAWAFERLRVNTRSSFNLRATSVTAITIKINGREQSISSQSGAEALRIATEAGIPLEEVFKLTQSSGTLATSQDVVRATHVAGPVTMVVCSKCHRKVPESAKCLYCGQVRRSQLVGRQPANEVDKRFLETNVVEERQGTATQPLRDTYEDRLKNL